MVIGVDLGPNLSVTGSVATILWLVVLRREGLEVGVCGFLRLGVFVMPPALVLSIIAMCVSLGRAYLPPAPTASASGTGRAKLVRTTAFRSMASRCASADAGVITYFFGWPSLSLKVFHFEQTHSTMRDKFSAYGVQGDQIHGPHSDRAKRMDRVHSSRRH